MSGGVVTVARLPAVEHGLCRDCGDEPTRTLGRFPFCDDCADEIIATIRMTILARDGVGVGVIHGHREPDLGPRIWQVACSVCRATWSGRNGDPCPWCAERLDVLREEQRRRLLHPDLPDRDDYRRDGVVTAWAARLANGVHSERITAAEARAAFDREKTP